MIKSYHKENVKSARQVQKNFGPVTIKYTVIEQAHYHRFPGLHSRQEHQLTDLPKPPTCAGSAPCDEAE